MKKFIIPLLTVVMVVSIILAGCAPAPAPPTPELPPEAPPPPPPAPALPKPGEWNASTGSSQFTFTFTVSPDSTSIPAYSMDFREFKCEGVQTSGGWEATVEPMLPITDGQFTIETEERGFGVISYTWDIVIQGKFDETGTQASGTWEISAEGTICQEGAWEASAP